MKNRPNLMISDCMLLVLTLWLRITHCSSYVIVQPMPFFAGKFDVLGRVFAYISVAVKARWNIYFMGGPGNRVTV